MKKSLLISLILYCTLPLAAQEEYFRSNPFGMLLELIPWYRVDEFEYTLTRTTGGEQETRRLFKAGAEYKRWEFRYAPDGSLREEQEFREDILEKVTTYRQARQIAGERFFRAGKLYRQVEYTYAAQNRLQLTRTYDGEGRLIYTDFYSLSPIGGLREIRREWADKLVEKATLIGRGGRLNQETHTGGEETIINHFDKQGNVESRELWRGDQQLQQTTFLYDSRSGDLQSLIEENISTGLLTERRYNQEGRVVREIITRDSETVTELEYNYDRDGRLSETRERHTEEGFKLTRFFYDPTGELDSEEQYIRGSLDTRIRYLTDEQYYVEHYNRRGEAVIRVYFENDVKYKEELLEDGEVAQTRTFE